MDLEQVLPLQALRPAEEKKLSSTVAEPVCFYRLGLFFSGSGSSSNKKVPVKAKLLPVVSPELPPHPLVQLLSQGLGQPVSQRLHQDHGVVVVLVLVPEQL